MHGRIFALASCLAVAGCGRAPESQPKQAGHPQPEAAVARQAAQDHSGKPLVKAFRASSDEELTELARIGLLEFKRGSDKNLGRIVPRKITLSDEAKALGLEIDIPDPKWPWGPTGVKAPALCELDFGSVTRVEPLAGGPLPAATVHYARGNVRQSALYARLGDAEVAPKQWCDPGTTEARSLVMVMRPAGWAANRAPVVRGKASIETNNEYDARGLFSGAVSLARLDGMETSDPDGDAVTVVGWKAAELRPSGGEAEPSLAWHDVPVEMKDGAVAFTHHVFDGKPSGGKVRYVVRDPWEEGAFEFCMEGYMFRC